MDINVNDLGLTKDYGLVRKNNYSEETAFS